MIRGTLAEVLADVTLDRSFLLVELNDGSFAVVEGTNEEWEKLSQIPQKITKVCVRFRSSKLELSPPNAKGYFFRPGVGALLSAQIQHYNLFVVGHLQEDEKTVEAFTVVVPELLVVNSDRRSRYNQETVGSSLIMS